MLTEVKLQSDVELAAVSPLIRRMMLSVAYAEDESGIRLTATVAMICKFVHWAAVNFIWPGFTAEDLYSMYKVLNENDMPPLWIVRDLSLHSKFLRRRKGRLWQPNAAESF